MRGYVRDSQKVKAQYVDVTVFITTGDNTEECFTEELIFLCQILALESDNPNMRLKFYEFQSGQIAELMFFWKLARSTLTQSSES